MKKTLLALALILSGSYLFAQLSIAPASYDTTIDNSVFDLDLHSEVINASGGTIEVEWTRTFVDKPKAWSTYVCTGSSCFPPETETGTFSVGSGKSSPLQVHFVPNNTSGCAEVHIKVSEIGNPSNSFTATYKVCAKGVSTNFVNAELIKIYPNPTSEYFKIQNNGSISKVLVSNLMGRTIKSYNSNFDRYDVSDFPAGMYIVQMLDSKGKNIKTSRLSIKRP